MSEYKDQYEGKVFGGELALMACYACNLYGNLRKDMRGRFKDNTSVETSSVEKLVVDNDTMIAITRNTAYALVGPLVERAVSKSYGMMALWDAAVAEHKVAVVAGFKGRKYPSTGQFRNAIRHAKQVLSFEGLDAEGNPMYAPGPYPKIAYGGTVKIHGTNGSFFKLHPEAEIVYQSKERVLSLESDNYGFYAKYKPKEDVINGIFGEVVEYLKGSGLDDGEIYPIRISGEYAGEGIQRGVAVGEVPRFFAIFGIAFGPEQNWLPEVDGFGHDLEDHRIFNIVDLGGVDILYLDVENPQAIQNELIERTLAVEKECPVGKFFGVTGVGEGKVWKPLAAEYAGDTGLWFKVKGEKHSTTKVKTLAEIDPVKLANIAEFVEYALTDARLDQGLAELFPDGKLDIRRTGDLLRWVNRDIHKEESDVLEKSGLTMKDISNAVGLKTRTWFFEQINNQEVV
ncbi:RNA ligase 2 [Acinetobacter phage ABPH49]|nr:RNA ligase 2 [Acinetobacter phage ABPH49]